MEGGLGDDLYVFRFSYSGNSIVRDTGGADDVLQFNNSQLLENLYFARSGDDLVVGELNSSADVTIEDQYAGGAGYIERVKFTGDGSYLELSDLTHDTTYFGTTGADTITGDAGSDEIHGHSGDDTLDGGGGDDLLIGGAGDDDLDGGAGTDTLDYSATTQGVIVKLNHGYADGTETGYDTIANFEHVITGSGDDNLTGNSVGNILKAGLGDDQYNGKAANDVFEDIGGNELYVISASSGHDIIRDTGGNSDYIRLNGGQNLDDLTFRRSGDDLLIELDSTGTDDITVENHFGSTDNMVETIEFAPGGPTFDLDQLMGIDAEFYGTTGNDSLTGTADNEAIHGLDGTDTISAGDGDDYLFGGDGLDTLTGGSGTDYFVFESASAFNDIDVMTDFDVGTDDDVIDISDVLDGYYDPMSDAITDFVQITDDGTDSSLFVDTTGSATFGAGTQIALIEDTTGLTDEAALVTSGNLLAA